MYTQIDFPTKKKLIEAVKRGEPIRIFAPGLGTPVSDGIEYIEGPHHVHTWYAQVVMKNGLVVKVK